MIDLDDLRKRPDTYQDAAKKKNIAISIADFLKLDQKRRELQKEVDGMRSTQNTASKKMPSLKGDEEERRIGGDEDAQYPGKRRGGEAEDN